MDLADVLQQDPNRLATSALNDMFNFQKQSLANQYQGLQNDRYQQVTPYEVAQQKLAGLRAGRMSNEQSLDAYERGTNAQFNIQDRANRRAQAVDDAGGNPEMLAFDKLKREDHTAKMAQGIDEVTQMFASGQTPEQVYAHVAQSHGQDVADYYKPIIQRGLKGVTAFHEYLLQNDPKYRTHIDPARISANATIAASENRQKAIDGSKTEFAKDKAVVANAKNLWDVKAKELQGVMLNSPEFKRISEEAQRLSADYQRLNLKFQNKYSNLVQEDAEQPTPKVRTYNPATGKVE